MICLYLRYCFGELFDLLPEQLETALCQNCFFQARPELAHAAFTFEEQDRIDLRSCVVCQFQEVVSVLNILLTLRRGKYEGSLGMVIELWDALNFLG